MRVFKKPFLCDKFAWSGFKSSIAIFTTISSTNQKGIWIVDSAKYLDEWSFCVV